MLNFRRIVHDLHKTFKEGPLLTHCSAGVGRTGTFIGLDRFLTAVLAEREESILAIVEDMRSHRNMMVQSQIQFVYLYLACLDGMERLASLLDKVCKSRQSRGNIKVPVDASSIANRSPISWAHASF